MVEGRQGDLAVRQLLETLTADEVEWRKRSLRKAGGGDDEEDEAMAQRIVRRNKIRQLMLRHGGGVDIARLLRAERQRRSREIDLAAGRGASKQAREAEELREFKRKVAQKRRANTGEGEEDEEAHGRWDATGSEPDGDDASVDSFNSQALVRMGQGIAVGAGNGDEEDDDGEAAAEAGDGVERRGAVRSIPSVTDLLSNRCHTEPIASAVFCPPDMLATAGMDGRIIMWSLATGQHYRTMHEPAPGGDVQVWEALAYCPRVKSLAAVGEGKDIRLWSTEALGVWSRYQALPEAPPGLEK